MGVYINKGNGGKVVKLIAQALSGIHYYSGWASEVLFWFHCVYCGLLLQFLLGGQNYIHWST